MYEQPQKKKNLNLDDYFWEWIITFEENVLKLIVVEQSILVR